jgi:hypothetical protein
VLREIISGHCLQYSYSQYEKVDSESAQQQNKLHFENLYLTKRLKKAQNKDFSNPRLFSLTEKSSKKLPHFLIISANP